MKIRTRSETLEGRSKKLAQSKTQIKDHLFTSHMSAGADSFSHYRDICKYIVDFRKCFSSIHRAEESCCQLFGRNNKHIGACV